MATTASTHVLRGVEDVISFIDARSSIKGRAAVGLAEHRNGADAHLSKRADHTHGNLAAVGDEDGIDVGHVPHIRKTP